MSTATPTAPQAATPASLPPRAAVRWYQLAVIVLGLALVAVTALAVYFAVNNPSATAIPRSDSTTVYSGHPCWQIRVPC